MGIIKVTKLYVPELTPPTTWYTIELADGVALAEDRFVNKTFYPRSKCGYKMVEFGDKTLEGIEKLKSGKLDAKYKKNEQSRRKLKELKNRVLEHEKDYKNERAREDFLEDGFRIDFHFGPTPML